MSDPAPPPLRAPRLSGLQAIPRWSIEHPYLVLAFYLAMIACSLIAIRHYLPRRFMPYVESPMIGVISMMPGLGAEEMELYFSKPIEEQMVNIKNVHFIRSTSQDGFSIVSLEFWYGTDMRKALQEVQSLMNVVQANLPATGANLKPSWVLAIDPLNLPVLTLSLTGDQRQGWDMLKLREFADNEVVNQLKTVPDVYSVVPFGGFRRQMQVLVDRRKLAAHKLSLLDVRNAIDRNNVSRPGGTVTSETSEAIVRFESRAVDARRVADYPIARLLPGAIPTPNPSAGGTGGGMSGGMGGSAAMEALTGAAPGSGALTAPGSTAPSPRVVYVRDVARVLDTHWERRSGFHFARRAPEGGGTIVPAIEIAILQNPSASSWQTIQGVRSVIAKLSADYPGVRFDEAYNNAHFVEILFENMTHELLLAVLLCGVVVFFFLGEWRGTLIAMVTIPTSLAMAVLLLLPAGMTLNSGTLIGLLLSIGRLVDDTIIDVHAVERHLRLGKTARQATIDGIGEVRLAVLASTFMIGLALSPLLFCGGIVQLMFRELVWPLLFGLLSSMMVSFTLTSLLCARWLRPEQDRLHDLKFKPYYYLHTYALQPVQGWLERLETGYGRAIAWMLRNRFTNLTRILATVIIGFGFYQFIGSEMMPLADVGQAYGVLEMEAGTSFAQTEQAVFAVERIMLRQPEIQQVATELGSENMLESTGTYYTGYGMPLVNAATFMITLSDMSERRRDLWQVIDNVQVEALRSVPGLRRFQIKEMGSDVMASSQAPISLLLYGPELERLEQLGRQVEAIAQETSGLHQVAVDWTLGVPTHEVRVDPQRAQEVGLATSEIAEQSYYALRGGFTNEFFRLPNLRQNTVLVRYAPDDRATGADLENLYLTTPEGTQLPLKSVATVEQRRTPTLITHDGMRRVITVLGYYRRGASSSMDLAMEVQMKALAQLHWPPGYGIEMRGDMTQMMDSFRRLFGGLLLAVFFMLLVLVAQFRGFLQPLQMVFSLPLELSGVFFLLWLTHQTFSTVSIMGVIVLTGMDLTTAILLIDMIMRQRDRGVPRDEAVITACPQRLRPILMTSLITIIVMIPVAFFPKTGMDAYSSVGVVVIGGLTAGTVLSLFDIPIMHTYVDDLVVWLNRVVLRRHWEWPRTAANEEETLT